MNSLSVVVFCLALAAVSAGVIAPLSRAIALAEHDTPVVAPALIAAHHGIAVAGPAVVAARGLIASPLTASGYPLLAPGSGIEGQYVHDFTETLYDNGQYHGEIYP